MRLELERRLSAAVEGICPVDDNLAAGAKARLDSLTKPPGSLGKLEALAEKLYCIQGGPERICADPGRIYAIAADHGVVAEGVTAFPREVTGQMVLNFLAGGAGINVLCKTAGLDLRVVDAGADCDFPDHPLLIKAKIARGTKSLAREAAMTREQCLAALLLGVDLAAGAAADGIAVVGLGEMGIGNTTPSSALFCAFYGFSAQEMTGMGAGAPRAGLGHKAGVIGKALELHGETIAKGDPVGILAALGGLEIAALAGLILGCAGKGIAVMVDGFISTAAYAAAQRIAPGVEGYCFFSHSSAESGHARVLDRLGKVSLLDMGFRLGEGTGAALGMFLLRSAADVFNDMSTFGSAGIASG